MEYASITLDEAEAVVSRNRFLSWDGWTITTWRKDERGEYDRRGQRRRGKWGILFRYPVQNDGTYRIPQSYVNR